MKLHRGALAIGLLCTPGCLGPGTSQDASLSTARLGEGKPMVSATQAADMKVMLAQSLEQQGEPDKAMAAYREAIRLDRTRADAYLGLAVLQDKQGRFHESEDLYHRALKADPANPDIFCDRGYSLYLQGHWVDAEMNLRQAIALKQDHNRAHNNLGLVLARTGRVEPALAEFRKAGCDEAGARANLAFCLLTDGHLEGARQQYQLALLADPTSQWALKGIRQVEHLIAKTSPPSPSQQEPDSAAQVATTTATVEDIPSEHLQPALHVSSPSQSFTAPNQPEQFQMELPLTLKEKETVRKGTAVNQP